MKIHLRMLGCRLNQAEIDRMARQLQARGHEIVDSPQEAEQVIVNTCAVTREASRASRQLIRDMHRANPQIQTTVTGCYAQIAPEEIRVLPGVTRVVDNHGKDTLIAQITGVRVEAFDHEPFARDVHSGAAGRTRAFVKVQDGCDNACTFCITTVARGEGRSRPLEEVVTEIRYLHESGYQEAVLTGVHLGSYGQERGERDGLLRLVEAILAETDIPRLRLSSLEPWNIAPGFFALWENPRLCRHLHLPLQSGCDSTLKRMRRNTTRADFRAIVATARAAIPDVAITSDVIVGFPSETEAEFSESLAFITEMNFSGLHVFRYSKRPGTPAAKMKGTVPKATQKARSRQLLDLSAQAHRAYAEGFIGAELSVLWEQVAGSSDDGFTNVGYTDNYVRVRAVHPRPLTNHITPVQVQAYDPQVEQLVVRPIME